MVLRKYRDCDSSQIQEIYNLSRPDEFYGEEEKFECMAWDEDEYISSIINDSYIRL